VEDETTKGQLRQVLTDVSELNEILLQTQNEAGTHRKNKAQIETELREAKDKIETLTKTTPDIEALKQKAEQYDVLLANQVKAKAEGWQKKAEIFAIPETDKRHSIITKIKDQFHFAAEGQALTEQQIDDNMRLMTTLEAAGTFEVSNNPQPGFPRPADTRPPDANIKTSGQALFTNKLT